MSAPAATRADVGLVAPAFTFLPLFAAKRRGFFAAEGIDCTYESLGGPDPVTEGLKAGRYQFSPTTPEGALADRAAGGDLVVIAGWTNRLPFRLIGLPRHTDLASLRGGTIGVSSLKEGTVHVIETMLASAGLQRGDYTFEVVGAHPQRWHLLQEGKIDAGLQLTPYDHMAIEAGFSDLGDPSAFIPEFAFSALVADRRWLAADEDAAVRVLRALLAATGWVFDTPDDAAQVLVEEAGADPRLARLSVGDLTQGGALPRDLGLSLPGLARVLEVMQGNHGLPADAPLDPLFYVDDRYLSLARAST